MKRKIVCIILVFVFLFLTGCKDNSLPVDRIVAETDEHRVFYSGDKCYIEFFEEYKKGNNPLLTLEAYHFIEVQSVNELRKKILENDFTLEDKYTIQRATTDEEGLLSECIFDIENMYEPVFPDKSVFRQITWGGWPKYTCVARYADSFLVYITYYETDYFAETYKREITDKIAKLSELDSYTVTQLDYRDAVEYRSDISKYVFYNMEVDGRKTTVEEHYYLVEGYGTVVSETVPYSIFMYVTDGDAHYSVAIDDPCKYFTEHPGEEWLLSFGMEPFVPEE